MSAEITDNLRRHDSHEERQDDKRHQQFHKAEACLRAANWCLLVHLITFLSQGLEGHVFFAPRQAMRGRRKGPA